MIVSACERLRSSCQKCTSPFISFSKYYILSNTAIWLVDSIGRDTEFFQIWDWWWNINNNISFISDFFPRKTKGKCFKKSKKPYFEAISDPFFPNLWKNEFSWKNGSVSFKIFQLSVPKSKKTNKFFVIKMLNLQKDRQTIVILQDPP